MKLANTILVLMVCALVACQTIYTGAVTLTKTVEAAARDYASIYNSGLVPPDVAQKVSTAHASFRKAAGIAADALEAGSGDPERTLESARTAALSFVDLLVELLPKPRVTELRARIKEAQVP